MKPDPREMSAYVPHHVWRDSREARGLIHLTGRIYERDNGCSFFKDTRLS